MGYCDIDLFRVEIEYNHTMITDDKNKNVSNVHINNEIANISEGKLHSTNIFSKLVTLILIY